MSDFEETARLPETWPAQVDSSRIADLSPRHPVDCVVTEQTPGPLRIDLHLGVEIGAVLSGAVERVFLDGVRRLHAGGVWMVTPFEPHGLITVTQGATVTAMFLPEFLGNEMVHDVPWVEMVGVSPSQRPQVLREQTRAKAIAVAHELREEALTKHPGWETAVRLNVLRLLLLLRRDWDRPPGASMWAGTRGSALERLMPALGIMHATPHSTISLARAARACSLSVRQFCRLFRNTMGVSFGRYCLRARLAAAARLLLTTDLSTGAIADRTGFTDASHLYRSFMWHYHTSPSAYRDTHRADNAGPDAGALPLYGSS